MAVLRGSSSGIVAAIMAIILLSGMQIFKSYLTASAGMPIVGGFLASLIFVLVLSALSSFEREFLGPDFQASFVEVLIALLTSVVAAATVHRVCVTTCILFSLMALFYMSKISTQLYGTPYEKILYHSVSKSGGASGGTAGKTSAKRR